MAMGKLLFCISALPQLYIGSVRSYLDLTKVSVAWYKGNQVSMPTGWLLFHSATVSNNLVSCFKRITCHAS